MVDLGTIKAIIGVETSGANQQLNDFKEKIKGFTENVNPHVMAVGAAVAGIATLAAKGISNLVEGIKQTADVAGNVQDASTRMGISAEEFQKVAFAAEQSGISMGTMESAAKKLKASGSNLTFTQAINELSQISDKSEQAARAQELFGKSAYELTPLLNEGADGIAALMAQADKYGLVMSNDAVAAGEAFGDSLSLMNQTIDATKNNLKAQFFPAMTDITTGIAGIVAGVDGSSEQLAQGISGFIDTFVAIVPQVVEIGTRVIEGLVNGIVQSMPQLITGIVSIITVILGGLVQMLPLLLNAGMKILQALILGIIQSLPAIVTAIINLVNLIMTTIIQSLPMLITSGMDLLMGLLTGILQALPQILAFLPQIITMICDTLTANIPAIISAGITIFVALISALPEIIIAIVSAVPQIITSIISALQAEFSNIASAGLELFIQLGSRIGEVIIDIKNKATEIINGFKEAITNKAQEIIDMGKNMVVGLWNGISDKAQWIKDKISEWVDNVIKFFKKLLGINSPSKVFYGYGEFITEGFANGILGNIGLATDAMELMARGIEDAFNPSLDAVNAAYRVNGTYGSNGSYNGSNGATSGNTITQNISYTTRELPSQVLSAIDSAVDTAVGVAVASITPSTIGAASLTSGKLTPTEASSTVAVLASVGIRGIYCYTVIL